MSRGVGAVTDSRIQSSVNRCAASSFGAAVASALTSSATATSISGKYRRPLKRLICATAKLFALSKDSEDFCISAFLFGFARWFFQCGECGFGRWALVVGAGKPQIQVRDERPAR